YGAKRLEDSLWIMILPYIEQGAVWAAYKQKFPGNQSGSEFVVKTYFDEADPSLLPRREGLCSYAANAILFAPRMQLKGVTDGTSNTIAYAQHYAYRCDGTQFNWAVMSTQPFLLNPPNRDGITLLRAATFADRIVRDAVPGNSSGLTFQVRP